jgi:hypothetical protein
MPTASCRAVGSRRTRRGGSRAGPAIFFLSAAARCKLLRRCRKRVAMAFRGATRHEHLRRQDCQAANVVALCPPMRQRVDLRQHPFHPRAASSQRLPPYKETALPCRYASHQPYPRTTRASVRPAKPASIPIDGSRSRASRPRQASSGSAQSRFIRKILCDQLTQ